jgi:hypothetical protein
MAAPGAAIVNPEAASVVAKGHEKRARQRTRGKGVSLRVGVNISNHKYVFDK